MTGASGAIGFEVCQKLLEADHEVFGVYNHNRPVVRSKFDRKFKPLKADLSKQESQIELAKFGCEEEVDVFIHCAGVAEIYRPSNRIQPNLSKMFEINTVSAAIIINNLLPGFEIRGFGRVVLVGSIVGDFGGIGLAGYAASKGALSALTRSINRELHLVKRRSPYSNITINMVKPGYCESNMTAGIKDEHRKAIIEKSTLGRFLSCEDVAIEICELIKPEKSYISGSEIALNGGQVL